LFEYTLGIGETEPNPVFLLCQCLLPCRFTADADFKSGSYQEPPAEPSLIVLKTMVPELPIAIKIVQQQFQRWCRPPAFVEEGLAVLGTLL
jgi:hypothetical protein